MRISDEQKGNPFVVFKDTQENIESLTSTEGMIAFATDLQRFGYYTSTSGWIWQESLSGVSAGITLADANKTIYSGITQIDFIGATISIEGRPSSNATVTVTVSGSSSTANLDILAVQIFS